MGKIGGKRYGQSASAVVRGTVILLCASVGLLFQRLVPDMPLSALLFFLFAGISDAFAWYFFFRSLCNGITNETVAVEKISVAFTSIASAVFFRTSFSFLATILIVSGIGWILVPQKGSKKSGTVLFAVLSGLFASAQMILSKFGLQSGVSSESGFWIRSSAAFVVLLILHLIDRTPTEAVGRSLMGALSLIASGVAAYFGWYFCYRGLSAGSAASVQAILKLNFWVTALFCRLFSGERLQKSSLPGYGILTVGILLSCFT
ncbi:MAG: EamA family transporter [Eubacteriales bacterium]